MKNVVVLFRKTELNLSGGIVILSYGSHACVNREKKKSTWKYINKIPPPKKKLNGRHY